MAYMCIFVCAFVSVFVCECGYMYKGKRTALGAGLVFYLLWKGGFFLLFVARARLTSLHLLLPGHASSEVPFT